MAKVALAQTPDHLEILGILARSEGSTARKKQTPEPGDTETEPTIRTRNKIMKP